MKYRGWQKLGDGLVSEDLQNGNPFETLSTTFTNKSYT